MASRLSGAPVTPDEVARPPATAPFGGGGDHSFTLQAVMEMHKSMGELKASVEGLRTTVDGVKTKVDDLIGWKDKILGGAAVLGAVIALGGFFVGKFWDNISFKSTATSPPQIVAPPTAIKKAA